MSVLNTNEEYPHPSLLLAPLPQTERGFGIHIDATLKGKKRLLYGNGRQVIMRLLDDPSVATFFNGHKANVNIARFAPNGEWVASGDTTGIILVWGARNQVVKNEVRCCRSILDLAWSPDSQRIVGAGDGFESFAKVFMWNSGNALGSIGNFAKKILSVDYRPKRPFRIAAVSEEKQMNMYEGPPFKFKISNNTHTNYPNCVRYSPDGEQFVTCGSDKRIIFFDGNTGEKLKVLENKDDGHEGSIYSVSWSPDGSEILTASGDRTCKVWDVASGTVKSTFTFGEEIKDMQVSCLWIEGYMMSVSLSGAINFLDRDDTSKPKRVINGHQTQVNTVDTSPDGHVYSGDSSGNIGQWECKSGECEIFSGDGHGDSLVCRVALSSDNKKLYSVGFDDKLFVSDVATLKTSDSWEDLEGQPTGLTSGNTDPDLCVVTTSKKALLIMKGGNLKKKVDLAFKATCVAISPDDTEMSVGGDDKKVHVYDLSAYGVTEKYTLSHAQCAEVAALCYSRDSKFITVTDRDRHTYLWERDGTHEKPMNPTGWKYHNARLTGCEWTKDNSQLITCSADEMFIVWPQAAIGKQRGRKKIDHAHFGGVIDMSVLDDTNLVTCGDDRGIKIWEIPS